MKTDDLQYQVGKSGHNFQDHGRCKGEVVKFDDNRNESTLGSWFYQPPSVIGVIGQAESHILVSYQSPGGLKGSCKYSPMSLSCFGIKGTNLPRFNTDSDRISPGILIIFCSEFCSFASSFLCPKSLKEICFKRTIQTSSLSPQRLTSLKDVTVDFEGYIAKKINIFRLGVGSHPRHRQYLRLEYVRLYHMYPRKLPRPLHSSFLFCV